MYPSDEVPVPGFGVMKGVPRYYDEILKDEDPFLYEKIKQTRLAFMREHADEYSFKRLYAKHRCKKARIAMKERSL